MKPTSRLVILACVVCSASSVLNNIVNFPSSNVDSLKFIAVITRHGSRSPLRTFPTDPYPYTDPEFWPNGPGELTSLGNVQLYHTGLYLNAMYRKFLNRLYNPNDTDITYNPYNRDYMSAACLSAGLFPPVETQVWNPSLMWQPVVQRVRNFDIRDLTNGELCPKFKKLSDHEEEKLNRDNYKHKELFELVSNYTGINTSDVADLNHVYDTLLMQAQNGYQLPEWTKKVFPSQLRPFAINYLIKTYAGNKELIQLGAGPELKYISDILTMKANGTYSETKKIYVEAAHDCTLFSLLYAMGNKDPTLEVQTGAFLVFELHYVKPNYVVQPYYYRTSYDMKPMAVKIKGCSSPCTLEDFNKLVDSINPPDYEQACKV